MLMRGEIQMKRIIKIGISMIMVVMLLSACSNPFDGGVKVEFFVDNPTASAISVQIDDTTHQIEANNYKKVSLPTGRHTLGYNDAFLDFVVIEKDQNVVMNPTQSNYIFYTEAYKTDKGLTEESLDKQMAPYMYDFTLPTGEVTSVPFRVIDNLFIEQYAYFWHFGLDEEMKENITINGGGADTGMVARSKLFRQGEFNEYIQVSEDELGIPLLSGKTFTDVETFQANFADITFSCAEATAGLAEFEEAYKQFISSDAKASSEAATALVMLPYQKIDTSENRKICEGSTPVPLNEISDYQKNMKKIQEIGKAFGEKHALVVPRNE